MSASDPRISRPSTIAERVEEHNTLRLPVKLVEPLGAEILLHLTGPGPEPIVARVDPPVRLRPGDVAHIAINTDHLHASDQESEDALM